MLFSLFRSFLSGNAMDKTEVIVQLVVLIFVFFICLPIHEFAHAWMANKLGDPTAKNAGRMTLNPLAHIDPIGGLMILFFGFGYAKGVPVNAYNFKNRKKGMAITALAGPMSNILLSIIFLLGMNITGLFPMTKIVYIFILFFQFAAIINIQLAVFNLLPIPPLDGSRLLAVVLPDEQYDNLMRYERIIMIVVLVLLATGILSPVISKLSTILYNLLSILIGLPFKLIG